MSIVEGAHLCRGALGPWGLEAAEHVVWWAVYVY